jgi:hypothetical protein
VLIHEEITDRLRFAVCAAKTVERRCHMNPRSESMVAIFFAIWWHWKDSRSALTLVTLCVAVVLTSWIVAIENFNYIRFSSSIKHNMNQTLGKKSGAREGLPREMARRRDHGYLWQFQMHIRVAKNEIRHPTAYILARKSHS